MTKDEVIRMADEADLWADQELQCIGEYHPDWHEVRDVRFATLVAAHALANIDPSKLMSYQEGYEVGRTAEREACARVCEAGIDMWPNEYHEEWNDACENRAAAIRARGEKK